MSSLMQMKRPVRPSTSVLQVKPSMHHYITNPLEYSAMKHTLIPIHMYQERDQVTLSFGMLTMTASLTIWIGYVSTIPSSLAGSLVSIWQLNTKALISPCSSKGRQVPGNTFDRNLD